MTLSTSLGRAPLGALSSVRAVLLSAWAAVQRIVRILATWLRVRRCAAAFPMPGRTMPLMGHFWMLLFTGDMPGFLRTLISILHESPVGVLWASVLPIFYVSDPRDIERIVYNSKCSWKSDFYTFVESGMNKGLVTISGDVWKRHHKIIAPTFHTKVLDSFVAVFNRQTDVFLSVLSKFSSAGGFDVMHAVERLTLDIIMETAMGINMNTQTDMKSELIKDIHTVEATIVERLLRPWLYPDWAFALSAAGRRQAAALATARRVRDSIIARRRRDLDSHERGDKDRLAFLDHLLLAAMAGENISYEEIAHEVDTFASAGFDTLSVLISYAFYELSRNPHIQEKAVRELESLYDAKMAAIEVTSEDVARMPFVEALLKETLRMHPPVPIFGRVLQEDVRLATRDLVIPGGAQVMISSFVVHMDATHFAVPSTFDPDRFLGDSARKRHPCAFIPFSAGQRSCIGKRFAMMEAKTVMAKVLWRFRILPDPDFQPIDTWSVSVKPVNGVRVRLQERRRTTMARGE